MSANQYSLRVDLHGVPVALSFANGASSPIFTSKTIATRSVTSELAGELSQQKAEEGRWQRKSLRVGEQTVIQK